jgi:hypothetical protein
VRTTPQGLLARRTSGHVLADIIALIVTWSGNPAMVSPTSAAWR